LQLQRIPLQGAGLPRGPTFESALRETLLTDPKTLRIIDQTFDRVPAAGTKNKKGSGHRIGLQGLAAHGGKAVDAFSIIPISE
jgi:hypothetical protein